MAQEDKASFIAEYLAQTWHDLAQYLLQHPEKLASSQVAYWQSYVNLCQSLSSGKNEIEIMNDIFDKRFQHQDWQKNLVFNFIKRSYQLLEQHVGDLSATIKDEKIAKQFNFYSQQFINSISPSNFISTNPELISHMLKTHGENIMSGLKQFHHDLIRGDGLLQISLTDTDQFQIGKNIACTEGYVVFQNDLIQLIQYHPVTPKVHQNPLLIIPPWINKYYILDLQQENSLVKWLVDQGYVVFMISWVNPFDAHKNKTFANYLVEGPLAALSAISKNTHIKNVNILGYCIGGTLLGCLLAYLAKQKLDLTISSATFLATLFDFSEPGELGTFIDEKQISLLETHVKQAGYFDGHIMATVFNALRANDLIWAAFVNNYLKGEPPKPFDFLFWNSDVTNIPAPTHIFYLRNMYLNNYLIQPNKIRLNKVALNLKHINIPCYFLATHDDHIAPWKSCFKTHHYLQSPTRFVLAQSGHVAGVINPPHKRKYGYWTGEAYQRNADEFLKHATFHQGSWWENWEMWLKSYAGKLVSAKQLKPVNKIEKAPGSYVRIQLKTKKAKSFAP